MSEGNDKFTHSVWIQEFFPVLNIPKQQTRIEELFQVLNDEIHHNPDIQRIWMTTFGTEEEFFSWYLSSTNRWWEYEIPAWVSKIDILKKLQILDKDLLIEWIEVFDGDEGRFYRRLMKKNYLADREWWLPINLSNEELKQALNWPRYWNFR